MIYNQVSPFATNKRVYAHYFYTFPLSIDNLPAANDYYNRNYLNILGEGSKWKKQGAYLRSRPLAVPVGSPTTYPIDNMKKEVAMAISQGIGGFTFDILGLADAMSLTGHLENICNAAFAVDPNFKIMPMPDMSALAGITQQQMVQLISSFTHDSIARMPDGRVKFAAFNATGGSASADPLGWWSGVIKQLNAADFEVAFLPVLLGNPTTSVLDPIALGTCGWGTANPGPAAAPASFMNPILSQQWRPKDSIFWESSCSQTFRNGWMSSMARGCDDVQIVTWSDFSESAQIQPYTDASLAPNIGTGFADICGYYASWFVSGQQPQILQDKLFFFYRKMQSNAPQPNQLNLVKNNGSFPEESNIELLAFLTAPGRLVINGAFMDVPAGIQSFKAPAAPGQPQFRLQRNGSDVMEFKGPVTIGPAGGVIDMTYWSGSH